MPWRVVPLDTGWYSLTSNNVASSYTGSNIVLSNFTNSWSSTTAATTSTSSGLLWPGTNLGWTVINNGDGIHIAQLTKEQERQLVLDQKRQQFKAQITGGVARNHLGREPRAAKTFSNPADFNNVTQPEMVALSLLKSMLPSDEWRRYLKSGIVIVVSPKTGITYQITRTHSHIRATRYGKPLAELCIYLKQDIKAPPTDHVIAKKIMLECSEVDVWNQSNSKTLLWGQKPSEDELRRLAA
jgi:2'-5' RNA ligase